jgi:hypothetical protein
MPTRPKTSLLLLFSGGPSDTTRPTVAITCAQTSPTATTPLNMTFTFSEDVTGFEIGDITVGNGAAGNFGTTSASVYTCDVTPTAAGSVTVDVDEGVAQDAAGNTNTAATQFVIAWQATLAIVPPSADNWMLAATPDTNNGTGNLVIRSSRTNLLKFDLSGIPPGTTIVSATLRLMLAATPGNSTVNIRRILLANIGWTELGSMWNFAVGATRWAGDAASDGGADAGCSQSGTDYSATLMGTFNTLGTDTANVTTYTASLDTTEFALMIANNAGMVLTGNAAGSTLLHSKDSGTGAQRPTLTVVYSNP